MQAASTKDLASGYANLIHRVYIGDHQGSLRHQCTVICSLSLVLRVMFPISGAALLLSPRCVHLKRNLAMCSAKILNSLLIFATYFP